MALEQDWIDVTADIDVGEDGRHVAGWTQREADKKKPLAYRYKAFIWNAVPVGFRIVKLMHEGRAVLVVEREG